MPQSIYVPDADRKHIETDECYGKHVLLSKEEYQNLLDRLEKLEQVVRETNG